MQAEPAWEYWELAGFAEAELRVFPGSPADDRQFEHFDASLALEPEVFRRWDDQDLTVTLRPFLRLDNQDDERTHADLREFQFTKSADRWDLKAGVGKVFWGVAESQHLVDTINQTDLVENIDGEEKLGQPMLNFTWLSDRAGNFGLFYLPYFRERTFPDVEGRLRTSPPVNPGAARYESDLEQWHPDAALRWTKYIGAFDLGAHYFHGTSRDPVFEVGMDGAGSPELRPVYNLMHQFGVDAQWTHESWLWKFEGIARNGEGQHFQAMVGGFEYTFYGVFDTPMDVGALTEYHFDSRGDEATGLLNNDIFAGTRLAFNDTQDSSLLAGAFVDHKSGSTSARLEFERRLGERYTIEVEGQWFAHSDRDDPVFSFRRDSYLRVALRRYF